MSPLTVLYDERCALCRKLRGWLERQPTLSPIEFLAADSRAARRRYPQLDHPRTTTVLTVVSGDGRVFEGERAWLVCAWTLPDWQQLAERLSGRLGLRLVRVFAKGVDAYRHTILDECGPGCRVASP